MKYNIEDFEPLYAFEGIGYLVSEHFLFDYRKYGTLVIYDKGMFRSYLSKVGLEKTLDAGLRLFSDSEAFATHVSEWRAYLEEGNRIAEAYKDKVDSVTKEEYGMIAQKVKECWVFHDKTEFIFTDKAFVESGNNQAIKENLKVLGEVKFTSSELLHRLVLVVYSKVVENIAKKFGVPVKDIYFYSESEVNRLFDGIKPDENLISERQKVFVMYGEHDEITTFSAQDSEEIAKAFRLGDRAVSELQGTIASKGVLKGKARIILLNYGGEYKDSATLSEEIREGEILVTENATPKFWPLLQKAGAIITNQGGMNSHAAIVARELGIPCIVGVNGATDIIKTGDVVEMDAAGKRGIIRINSHTK